MSDQPIQPAGSTPPTAPLPTTPARCPQCGAPLQQDVCPACAGGAVTTTGDEAALVAAPAPVANDPVSATDATIPAAASAEFEAAAAAESESEAARCENCGEPLQGEFCHRCGQSVHNPIRNAAHALEELFESLWHLDSRVFRTLRDLLVPARVACEYLAGHRARYIAPMRLFVILSVLTFFIGQFTVDFGTSELDSVSGTRGFSTAMTVAEVERRRDAQLAGINAGRREAGDVAFVDATLVAAESRVRAEAATRIAELRDQAGGAGSDAAAPAASTGTTPASTASDESAGTQGATAPGRTPTLRIFGDAPWHEQDNPVALRWLPASANRWLNHKIGRALANSPRLRDDPELRKRIVLGSVPTALFVLMPLFALLLKIAYITKRRLYLEHLVVALYSHAFLLLALLVVFVLVGVEHWLVPHAPSAAGVFGWIEGAVWWAMPIYLLIMQKRVYGQGWTMTTLKYFVLGSAYLVLVTTAALFAGFAGLAKL